MSELDRARAGQYVAARRGRLGLSQDDLAARAGIDPKTLRDLETGKRWPRATTRASIEQALGWESGDLLRAAAGEEPVFEASELLMRCITRRADELGLELAVVHQQTGLTVKAGPEGGVEGGVPARAVLDIARAADLDRVLRWRPGSTQAILSEWRLPVPLFEQSRPAFPDLGLSQEFEMRRPPSPAGEGGETASELLAQARRLLQELEEAVYSQPTPPSRKVRAVKQFGLAVEALEDELGDAG